jgi:hypothetical protein
LVHNVWYTLNFCVQILVLRLLWRRQVSTKFFTLKDRIDNRPLLQRPLNCRPMLVSCKLGVGEGLFKRKGGWVYLYCSQAWEQGFYISGFPCPSDNVKNSAIFACVVKGTMIWKNFASVPLIMDPWPLVLRAH